MAALMRGRGAVPGYEDVWLLCGQLVGLGLGFIRARMPASRKSLGALEVVLAALIGIVLFAHLSGSGEQSFCFVLVLVMPGVFVAVLVALVWCGSLAALLGDGRRWRLPGAWLCIGIGLLITVLLEVALQIYPHTAVLSALAAVFAAVRLWRVRRAVAITFIVLALGEIVVTEFIPNPLASATHVSGSGEYLE